MRKIHLVALLAAALLSACGGGSSSSPAPTPDPVPDPKPRFGAQISFGDSLSDVGTYAVGTVKMLGGGKFTVNGDNTAIYPALTGQNWTEVTAARFGLPAPCAAQTGLDGHASSGFWAPVVNHAGCFGYAQGGSRVTNPVGPNNKLTGSALGALTVPVTTQIANHLAVSGGQFKPDDIVFVMAGGNDVLFQLGALSAGAAAAGTAAGNQAYIESLTVLLATGATNRVTAAQAIKAAIVAESKRTGSTQASVVGAAVGAAAVQPGNSAVASSTVYGPKVIQATADANAAGNAAAMAYFDAHGPDLVTAMATAGGELAALVKTQIVAKGARFVTVNNLPDVASTPAGLSKTAEIRTLMTAMAQAFNAQLVSGLSAEPRVLLVDAYALSQAAAANPAAYGLTNVTETACDLTAPKNALGSSLVCNGTNLMAGDVSRYAYADDVHPTPYNYGVLARYVMDKMMLRGWL